MAWFPGGVVSWRLLEASLRVYITMVGALRGFSVNTKRQG
jgi:hypothetical protein